MSSRDCQSCKQPLRSANPRALYCSSNCRARATKQRANGVAAATPLRVLPETAPVELSSIVDITRKELELLGALDTVEGAAVLAIAERIATRLDTASAVATAAAALREAIVDLRNSAARSSDLIGDLQARRRGRRERGA